MASPDPSVTSSGGDVAVPHTFWQYLGSLGPGIVIALTWLGAGDLVDTAVAGGSYGYALMWAMALALFVRFVFVSIIAKYHLCNQHGESVLAGLKRIHPSVPILVGIIALFFGHFYGSFLVKGVGETTAKLLAPILPQLGADWIWPMVWSAVWVIVAAAIVFRGLYGHIEKLFYVLLGVLTVSLIGVALWSGPNPAAALRGTFLFALPEQTGPFGAVLLVTSLIGAVGGSIANLLYPYFIEQKGWRGPRFRRLQLYDLAFGTGVLIVLDLAVWTVGAELLHPRGIVIENLDDLAALLTEVLGRLGGIVFFMGVFAALYSSVIGNAIGYGYMLADLVNVCRSQHGRRTDENAASPGALPASLAYRLTACWCLFSPLVWCLPNMPGFITLTIVANAAGVIVLPVLSASLWYITARKSLIGAAYCNRLWENLVMGALFLLALWGAFQSLRSIEQILFAA